MKCTDCKQEIPEGESYKHQDIIICEDCYIGKMSVPKTCDPTAVYSASRTREMLGQTGTSGLTVRQTDLYNFIRDKGKVTHQEIADHFNLSLTDIQKEFSVLRHCKLVKGTKEKDTVYLMLM